MTFQTHGLAKYGRNLPHVILLDGLNLNLELVKDGWCWWYRKYAPGNISNSLRKTVVLSLHRLQTASVTDAVCISRTHF